MIYVIGTCHKTQIVNDQVRRGALGTVPLAKVLAFQKYLTDTAKAVGAIAVCEELTAERVLAWGDNAVSIAETAAKSIGIRHAFCEPTGQDREQLGLRSGDVMVKHARDIAERRNRDFLEIYREEVRKQFPVREKFWLSRLKLFEPGTYPLIFVCGADHSQSFVRTAMELGLPAVVHCEDWTTLAEIPCPCCL